jgi:Mo-co oxidoreductase dimerisation domain
MLSANTVAQNPGGSVIPPVSFGHACVVGETGVLPCACAHIGGPTVNKIPMEGGGVQSGTGGHLDREPEEAALGYQIGPKSVITRPSGGQQLPGRGFYEISGLAWSGGGAIRTVEVSTDGGRKWNRAEIKGTAQRMAHTRFGYQWNWDGNETEILSRCTDEIGQVQPTREQVAQYWNVPFDRKYRVPGLGACPDYPGW